MKKRSGKGNITVSYIFVITRKWFRSKTLVKRGSPIVLFSVYSHKMLCY